ncbi:MAG TPA: nitrite/sulfite reductase [Egibacteraceae bacterium]|nr:nitrite/sulfite reductase [Egibacteraceae bacterium]
MLQIADFAEIDEFEQVIARWRSGEIDEEEFRTRRLHMGCYGIRQSDTHMIRIKVPGGLLRPEHLDALADVSERYSRGFAHITTRQNFQLHFVNLDDVPALMRHVAEADMTTREACGNSIRNVTQSHLAGIDPTEVVDTRPAVETFVRYFLRHPAFQSLPRKFKIAFDGSPRDVAQLGIHDIGLLGMVGDDGATGFRLFVGGGLGSAPREADVLEPFTPASRLLPTAEAILTIFNEHGERRNRVRARMKFLLNKWGIDKFREEVFALREELEAERAYPDIELPVRIHAAPDAPLPPPSDELAPDAAESFLRWRDVNVFPHPIDSGVRYAAAVTFHLGDVTVEQFRALAKTWRELGDHVEVRTTIRQNLLFTHLTAEQLSHLYTTLRDGGMDLARAEKSGDVVSCPGAETCNLAITASRGLADAVTDALVAAGLHEVEDLRINISGCPNACGQHTSADIGFSGMARRDPKGNEAPGYRIYVGARIDSGGAKFGHYVAKVPAKTAPQATVEIVGRYASERAQGEAFADWVARVTPDELKASLKVHDTMPAMDEDPAFYLDWGNSRQFEVILGRGECA